MMLAPSIIFCPKGNVGHLSVVSDVGTDHKCEGLRFSPTAPVCSPIQHGQLVWRDDHHYTTDYAVAKRGEVWDALLKTGALGHR